MGKKGDFLELIESAPIGVDTLTASVWKWTHHERSRKANEALARQSNVNVSTATLSFGGPLKRRPTSTFASSSPHQTDGTSNPSSRVDVRDGRTRWIGHPTRVTELSLDETAFKDTDIGLLFYPGAHFLGVLTFGDPVEDEVAGRRCWKVDATAELGRHAMRMFPMSMRLGGIDHTFWIDAATGIVLRHVGLADDEPWSITEFKEVRINPPLADSDFQFVAPPNGTVERRVDQLLRMAEVRGIDLTGVDREDPQAVQEAVHDHDAAQPSPTRRGPTEDAEGEARSCQRSP